MKMIATLLLIIFILALIGAIYIYSEVKNFVEETVKNTKNKIDGFERSGYFLQQIWISGQNSDIR